MRNWKKCIEEPISKEEHLANKLYSAYRKEVKYIQPNTLQVIYSACLYISHILSNNSKPYQYFIEAQTDKKHLYKYIKKVSLNLNISISIKTIDRINNIIRDLDESPTVKDECFRMIDIIRSRNFEFSGNYMATIAALLYIVKNVLGFKISINDVSSKFNIDKGVLKSHRLKILKYL